MASAVNLRHRWAVTALVIDSVAVVVVFIVIAIVTPRNVDHDDHFAVALLLYTTVEYLAIMVTICSSVALIVALIGTVRKRERGILPAVAVAVNTVLATSGIVGLLRFIGR